ncbi:MAG: glycoside hydrolase family 5 protein [Actinomycetia bacterium]|nr:glycoside hydrolase family 5 protein [Actinomycetes bacterium]
MAAACGSGKVNAVTTKRAARAVALIPLHATRGAQPAIVDARGRQVILRGVNLNSYGDYYQDNRKLPPVVPVTEHDWADMASHGFNVVRLLVSWSSIEPKRGLFDDRYLARVRNAVHTAAAHGIYSVIDMHQDAWGKYIASPRQVVCPPDRTPALGWDGAPKWATLTQGASTCIQGSRENSEAVLNAWDSFYANRNGIMDQLIATWSHVARFFERETAVAGYDLLNEPNHGHDGATATEALGHYYAKAITAIRAAEAAKAAHPHIVFFEHTVFGVPVPYDFTTDTNIVFAPHNYGESIGNLPIEGLFDYFANLAKNYKTAMWVGEYGWFSDPPAQASKLARYAAKEEQLLSSGDAWWQWRQACGDPHSIGKPGGVPDAHLVHFRANNCPGDHDGGVIADWACVWRPYPRAAPGRLTRLHSTCNNEVDFDGHADRSGTIDVWFPNHGTAPPTVSGTQLSAAKVRAVPGGWRISARVNGDYTVRVATG